MKNIIFILSAFFVITSCDNNKKEKESADHAYAIFRHQVDQDSIGLVRIKEYIQWSNEMYAKLIQLGYSDKKAHEKIDSFKINSFLDTYNEIPKWYYDFKKIGDSSFSFDLKKVGENY